MDPQQFDFSSLKDVPAPQWPLIMNPETQEALEIHRRGLARPEVDVDRFLAARAGVQVQTVSGRVPLYASTPLDVRQADTYVFEVWARVEQVWSRLLLGPYEFRDVADRAVAALAERAPKA